MVLAWLRSLHSAAFFKILQEKRKIFVCNILKAAPPLLCATAFQLETVCLIGMFGNQPKS
jgi:hypothetical protein